MENIYLKQGGVHILPHILPIVQHLICNYVHIDLWCHFVRCTLFCVAESVDRGMAQKIEIFWAVMKL